MDAIAISPKRNCCQSGYYLRRGVRLISFSAMAVMFAPLLLPMLGIGEKLAIMTNNGIICSAALGPGLIGRINNLLSLIPFIGNIISANSITAVAIGIIFIFIAPFTANKTFAALLFIPGFFFCLPATLPALGHGIKFLAMLLGYEAAAAGDFIGSPAKPMPVYSFISSGGVMIAAHLNCIISGIVVILGVLLPSAIKK